MLALDTRSHGFRPVSGGFPERFTDEPFQVVQGSGKTVKPLETPDFSFPEKAEKVENLLKMHWGKVAIIEKLWNVKAGGSAAYRQAQAEYNQIVETMEESEAQS